MSSLYCPKCALESPADLRFCRRCGTDLGAVSRALAPAQPSESNTVVRLLQLDTTWQLLRGLVTLGIAIPFSLFMGIVVGTNIGLSALVVVQSIMLVFTWLGIRDLKQACSASKAGARRQTARMESPQGQLPSVTEHTTFPLEMDPTGDVARPRGRTTNGRGD